MHFFYDNEDKLRETFFRKKIHLLDNKKME